MHGIEHWAAQAADREALHRELPTTDVLVVLGGDGTFLRAARAVIEVDVPLLGINLGKVGFLSKVEASELENVLAQLVAGRYTIEPRMALEGRILRGGGPIGRAERHHRAQRRRRSRAARWPASCRLDDEHRGRRHLATFVADGLVVASPTGSTGYSFSRRRPDPRADSRNLVVTPIAGLPDHDPLGRRRAGAGGPLPGRRRARGARLGRRPRGHAARGRRRRRGPGASTRPIRLVEPEGSQPFWDLFRQKVELLPS